MEVSMATYLLTWNPEKWNWKTLAKDIAKVAAGKQEGFTWSTGNTKKIRRGDRLFCIRQGRDPRGIFASGHAISDVFDDTHWSDDRLNDVALYVEIKFDVLFDPDDESGPGVLTREDLLARVSSIFNWQPFASGTTIPSDVAARLEEAWAKHLGRTAAARANAMPDELSDPDAYVEGAKRLVVVNAYERSEAARQACIAHWGIRCDVCGMSFDEVYGKVGAGFIHVHHLSPLAAKRRSYKVNPVKDLRPVCPNCHAMLHQEDPPMSIEKLRGVIKKLNAK